MLLWNNKTHDEDCIHFLFFRKCRFVLCDLKDLKDLKDSNDSNDLN